MGAICAGMVGKLWITCYFIVRLPGPCGMTSLAKLGLAWAMPGRVVNLLSSWKPLLYPANCRNTEDGPHMPFVVNLEGRKQLEL